MSWRLFRTGKSFHRDRVGNGAVGRHEKNVFQGGTSFVIGGAVSDTHADTEKAHLDAGTGRESLAASHPLVRN